MKTFYYRHNFINNTPHIISLDKILFNELTFVIKGELNYQLDGKGVTVQTGDCIFVRSGSIRQRNHKGACDYVSFNFENDPPFELPLVTNDCITDEIRLIFSVCDEIFNNHFEWSDKIDNLLVLVFKLLKEKILSRKENPVIIKIKRFIQENLNKKLSLFEISSAVGYSPNYCDTLFKKETNCSIVDYLISERISEAKRLLAEGILPLKEISETVGFSDYNYFSRIFKKKSGYSPTQYKQIRLIR